MTHDHSYCNTCKEFGCKCPTGSKSTLIDGLSAAASFDNCAEVLRSLVDAVKGQAEVSGKESIRVRVQRIKAEAYLKALGR